MRNMIIKSFEVEIEYEDGKKWSNKDDEIKVVNKTLAVDCAKSYARKAGFVGKIKKIEVDGEKFVSGEERCVKEKKNVNAPVTNPDEDIGDINVANNANAEKESKSPMESDDWTGRAV